MFQKGDNSIVSWKIAIAIRSTQKYHIANKESEQAVQKYIMNYQTVLLLNKMLS